MPHLAKTMPVVTSLFPWLLVLMGLMVVGALVAAIDLARYSLRLTQAEAQAASERVGSDYHRSFARYLRRVKLVLRVGGVVGFLFLGVVGASGSLRPDWAEFFFCVVYLGLWTPFYIAFGLLARGFEKVAKRMEQLLREDLHGKSEATSR
jgi:hypothetical protein